MRRQLPTPLLSHNDRKLWMQALLPGYRCFWVGIFDQLLLQRHFRTLIHANHSYGRYNPSS